LCGERERERERERETGAWSVVEGFRDVVVGGGRGDM
jgi:hypothetical protein